MKRITEIARILRLPVGAVMKKAQALKFPVSSPGDVLDANQVDLLMEFADRSPEALKHIADGVQSGFAAKSQNARKVTTAHLKETESQSEDRPFYKSAEPASELKELRRKIKDLEAKVTGITKQLVSVTDAPQLPTKAELRTLIAQTFPDFDLKSTMSEKLQAELNIMAKSSEDALVETLGAWEARIGETASV